MTESSADSGVGSSAGVRAVSGLSRWIALRYLLAGQHQYARFISWVSLVGIALGVAVLILVLSVMNGFDRELTQRILGTVPHVLVEAEGLVPAELESSYPAVVSAFPFFQSQAMVTRSSSVSPVAIYGIDAQGLKALPMLTDSASVNLVDALNAPRTIVLGAPLARSLGLLLGDSVMVMLTTATASRVKPQFERFVLTGTFEIGAELDFGLALVSLAQMRAPRFSNTGSFGTRLVLNNPYVAPELAGLIQTDLQTSLNTEGAQPVVVSHWGETYGELFRAVKHEKTMMFVLLVLIVGIASFNVVAGQAMLVNDKRGDIAILRTMGAGDGAVLSIFLLQGFLTSLLGVLLGVLLGIVLAQNVTDIVGAIEELTGARVLEGTYFIEVPSQLLWADVGVVVLLALAISAVAALLPAWKALAVNPVTALHE